MKRFLYSILVGVLLVYGGSVLGAEGTSGDSSYIQLVDGTKEDFPRTYSGRMKLSDALSASGYPEEARNILVQLMDEYPDNSDVQLKLGFLELKLGNSESARDHFRAITKFTPDYADAWYGLGLAYRRLNQPKKSLDALNQSIEESPERADFYVARGHTQKSQGQFSKAIEDYTRASELDSSAVEFNRLIRSLDVSAAREPAPWLARLGHGVTHLKDNGTYWRYYTADLGYDADMAYVNFNFRREQRGDTWDSSLGLDAYFDLWKKSYGNIRYQHSPDHVFLPEHDAFLEYYHPFEDGWIGSVNYRLREYDLIDVSSYGARIARYRANWYYRLSGEFIKFSDRDGSGLNSSVVIRNYYWNNDDDYMQIYASAGNGIEPLVTGPTRNLLDSNSVGFFMRKFLTDSVGLDFLLDHTDPEDLSIRQTAEVGLFYRW